MTLRFSESMFLDLPQRRNEAKKSLKMLDFPDLRRGNNQSILWWQAKVIGGSSKIQLGSASPNEAK